MVGVAPDGVVLDRGEGVGIPCTALREQRPIDVDAGFKATLAHHLDHAPRQERETRPATDAQTPSRIVIVVGAVHRKAQLALRRKCALAIHIPLQGYGVPCVVLPRVPRQARCPQAEPSIIGIPPIGVVPEEMRPVTAIVRERVVHHRQGNRHGVSIDIHPRTSVAQRLGVADDRRGVARVDAVPCIVGHVGIADRNRAIAAVDAI